MNIIYLGFYGFPYGLAECQKIILISKSLVLEGGNVTVIGKRGIHLPGNHPDLRKVGHYQGIKYIYSSNSPFRISGVFKRNIYKLLEPFLECITIYRLNKREKIDSAIISSMSFMNILSYRVLSRLFGFKIVLNLVEYNTSISGRESLKFKINDYFFDRFAVKVSDGILVISEFLIQVIRKIAPGKPFLKIPMMVDADRYDGINKCLTERYFLFCGSTAYLEVIYFILNAFELLPNNELVYLYLVINGTLEQRSLIENRITGSKKSKLIKIFSNISDKDLSGLYLNALGLLIPMRPTIQDLARFPHKFGEYLLSGNPVVTTNNGEVKHYFKDMENALVAENYDEKEFADKLHYIIDHKVECVSIGQKGKVTGLTYANYKVYGKRIINFIANL